MRVKMCATFALSVLFLPPVLGQNNNATNPMQVRLAYAGSTGMTISWNTYSQLTNPAVKYGLFSSLNLTSPVGVSITYPSSSTYNNHAKITGLLPDTLYYYQPQPTNLTAPFTFRTSRLPGDTTAFSVACPATLLMMDYWRRKTRRAYLSNTTPSAGGNGCNETLLNRYYDEGVCVLTNFVCIRSLTYGDNRSGAPRTRSTKSPYHRSTPFCVPGQPNFTGYREATSACLGNRAGGVGISGYPVDPAGHPVNHLELRGAKIQPFLQALVGRLMRPRRDLLPVKPKQGLLCRWCGNPTSTRPLCLSSLTACPWCFAWPSDLRRIGQYPPLSTVVLGFACGLRKQPPLNLNFLQSTPSTLRRLAPNRHGAHPVVHGKYAQRCSSGGSRHYERLDALQDSAAHPSSQGGDTGYLRLVAVDHSTNLLTDHTTLRREQESEALSTLRRIQPDHGCVTGVVHPTLKTICLGNVFHQLFTKTLGKDTQELAAIMQTSQKAWGGSWRKIIASQQGRPLGKRDFQAWARLGGIGWTVVGQ
ncbi:hypothetical protein BS47DRAFT_1404246 [Hydnum rufescens UP504]|uniref:Fibronectin type-III domain-containing protein n=1 Tax=Hydnum rufescens UP504 TaxID=1448309 RepID=A0A9P6BDS2_9AGAM|nr:hypothetical protein BS47DRAFT_1404246 [Hydnum rufescens UP504]